MDIVGENNTLCREVEPRDFGMSGDDRRSRDLQQVFAITTSSGVKASKHWLELRYLPTCRAQT